MTSCGFRHRFFCRSGAESFGRGGTHTRLKYSTGFPLTPTIKLIHSVRNRKLRGMTTLMKQSSYDGSLSTMDESANKQVRFLSYDKPSLDEMIFEFPKTISLIFRPLRKLCIFVQFPIRISGLDRRLSVSTFWRNRSCAHAEIIKRCSSMYMKGEICKQG